MKAILPWPPKWAALAAIFGAVLIFDQVTKYMAVDRLTFAFERNGATTFGKKLSAFMKLQELEPYRKPAVPVIEKFWHMKYVENPGAAWGFFQGMSEPWRGRFFTAISLGAVAFILAYYRRLGERQRYLQIASALVLGGAVGNFVDRLIRGYVIDFIDWHWLNKPDLHWPTFNIADAAICVGVAMFVIEPRKKPKAAASEPAAPV
jgi:signal peptidase II